MKQVITIMAAVCLLLSCGGRGAGTKIAAGGADSSVADRQNTEERGVAQAHQNAEAAEKGETEQGTAKPAARVKAKDYTFKIIKEFPHDEEAYTQGLFWHEGYLYEGTGQNGHSELRKVELATGKVVKSVKLAGRFFGEGIALLGNSIYQLTWTEGRAFVYDAETFRQTRSVSYDGEGWGLTTDGEKLYMSDGSETIYVRDPDTFAEERAITVVADRRNVYYINEMEWIDGEIWANIYTYNEIVRIDPATGNVTGIIDFSGIQSSSDRHSGDDVFNGIAYDSATGNIYVTGKLWNKVYQVEIVEKTEN
jgi:glutamine cyclotransferase